MTGMGFSHTYENFIHKMEIDKCTGSHTELQHTLTVSKNDKNPHVAR